MTCFTAGLLTVAMGLASNYPLALARGMGLNAVVAFELVAARAVLATFSITAAPPAHPALRAGRHHRIVEPER